MQMLYLLIHSDLVGAMGIRMILAVSDNQSRPALNLEAFA